MNIVSSHTHTHTHTPLVVLERQGYFLMFALRQAFLTSHHYKAFSRDGHFLGLVCQSTSAMLFWRAA